MAETSNDRNRRRLVLMVKEPRAGWVKTRLAREIGTAAALRFYRTACANLIRRLSSDPRWCLVLAISPDRALTSRAWPPSTPRIRQGTGNLGDRMGRLLHETGPRATIIIGSDIPGIQPQHIAEAFRMLEHADAVLGPAEDGGYWLVGMKPVRPFRDIFRNVRWSSSYTLDDTLANFKDLNVAFTQTLEDVDDAGSFKRNAHLGMRVTPAR
ncbi:MAG: TIGR04282 family arsenosugar biosynthesis glycosyltransferase [Hyphomicrobiales bacterium]|nr:TIGR04282 family arsenosugar biosynthesis glycosyltransferase [Hyphomicrobiales bacterium]